MDCRYPTWELVGADEQDAKEASIDMDKSKI
jgi:hypothetical protein